MTDLNQLLGDTPADDPTRTHDEPDTSERLKRAAMQAVGGGRAFIEAGKLKKPVTKNFLSIVFDIEPETVTKRLIRCPTLGLAGGQRPLYDFKTACQYLVPPLMDMGEYIRSLGPDQLPNKINKTFWEAQRTELRYRLEAGDAWETDKVLDVFGRVFMTIKDRTQIWRETVRNNGTMNDAAVARFDEMVDAFLEDIHRQLIDEPNQNRTTSKLADIREGD